MISPIYQIQNRGQVVNNACQWLWEHHRLAFRIMFLPTILAAVLLALNMLFIDSGWIYTLVVLYGLLLLPVLPCLMFHVVEHPETSGYPKRMPRMKTVLAPWWRYFWPLLLTTFISCLAMFLAMFTVFGGFALSLLIPLAVVVCQRDEDAGVGALLTSAKLVKDSFGNFCLVSLGVYIIVMSMMFAPFVMVMGIGEFLREFMNRAMMISANSLFKEDVFVAVATFMMMFGGALSIPISTVIYHFFYGHCKEKEEHPALIERMEQFDEE